MGNLNNFNSAETEPTSMDFDPLPPGKYLAHIAESEVKETAKGGEMLKLTVIIDQAGFENRRVWTNLNIVNASEKAQQIALGMLSALCRAVGKVGIVSDSSQLHDKPFIVALGIEPGSLEYPNPKNKVTGFFPKVKDESWKEQPPVKQASTKGRKNVKQAVEEASEVEEEQLPDFLK